MRLSRTGRLTIPAQVRRQLGFEPDDDLEVVIVDGVATIVAATGAPGRGQRAVDALLGRGETTMTTDEIMALTRGE